MSDLEGIDQNGGVPEQQDTGRDVAVVTSSPAPEDQTIPIDTSSISDMNTSLVPGDTTETTQPSETEDTIEDISDVSPTSQEEALNQSRELKSLLALSKEAKLDTNISRKRKILSFRKKSKGEGRVKGAKIQYPITAESELEMELHNTEGSKPEVADDDGTASNSSAKLHKRKKRIMSEASDESVLDEGNRKGRKSFTAGIVQFKPNKDMFCWRCHKDQVNIACETCPRSYHQKCLKQTITDAEHWPCPECVAILKAESTNSRSPAMKGMTLEHLCNLLKFAVSRMIQCQGSEPFIHEVNDADFPEYKKYIIQPMDLTLLEKNIKENLYGSTQAFETDAKWILHNSIVFNSYQSKLTTVAKSIMKICKQEMSEIENCPSCYLNANTKKKTWFVEVCPKPHLLVWAKLRGFPFWPGKAMKCKDGMVDVRFFGAHDRAWVPEKECFLYSPKDPNLFRVKRADIEQCIEELKVHAENLKKVFGEFTYPPFKIQIDPDREIKQLQMFLPRYKQNLGKSKDKRMSLDTRDDQQQAEEPSDSDKTKDELETKEESSRAEDESMEGYGTDDESMTELDTEVRKNLRKFTDKPNRTRDNMETDDDDTQVPANVEVDASGSEEVVLTKPKKKTTPVLEDSSNNFRRNSDPKINRVDISEDMEISLGNGEPVVENVSSSNSECSSDFSVEFKKRPVQVDVNNVEFTISPASKLKITDKLIKRLSDGENGEGSSSYDKVERVKRNLDDKPNEGDGEQEPKQKQRRVGGEDNEDDAAGASKDDEPNEFQVSKQVSSDDREEAAAEMSADSSKSVNWTVEDVSPKSDRTKIVIKAVRVADKVAESAKEDKSEKDNGDADKVDDVDKLEHIEAPVEDLPASDSSMPKATPQVPTEPPLDTVPSITVILHSMKDTASREDDKPEEPVNNDDHSVETNNPPQKEQTDVVEDSTDNGESSNAGLSSDEDNMFLNIIHSSLVKPATSSPLKSTPVNETSANSETLLKQDSKKAQKRKKGTDPAEMGEVETQNKIMKIVSVETVTNKENNNEKESLLRTSLQAKKIHKKPGSTHSSRTSSARNSVQEILSDEIKSEPESEAESVQPVQDMEAKKKYLSALNILEKGAADAQKIKPNEIRTRSKTEEKRERFRTSNEAHIDKLSKTIDEVAVNHISTHKDDCPTAAPKKKIVTGSSNNSKSDGGEIYVRSFAKLSSDAICESPTAMVPTPPCKQRARKSFPHPNYAKSAPPKPATAPATQPTVSNQKQITGSPAFSTFTLNESVVRLTPRSTAVVSSPLASVTPMVTSVVSAPKSALPQLQQQLDAMRPTNGYLILQPQQHQENLVFLPPNQTISYTTPLASLANQVVSMTPCLLPASSTGQQGHQLTAPHIWYPGQAQQPGPTERDLINVASSQNYIPQGEPVTGAILLNSNAAAASKKLVNGLSDAKVVVPSPESSNSVLPQSPSVSQPIDPDRSPEIASDPTPEASLPSVTVAPIVIADGEDEDFTVLNSIVPDVSRTINDRPPPRLKPRPPGVLSQQFSEGVPSSAGPAAAKINSIAHRLGDYFRGMLIETLEDLSKTGNTEATIASLKLEIDTLKHKHRVEISEIENNVNTVLKDLQRSIVEDKEKAVEEARAACEVETIQRVEEAKSKQWCANCSKEAQFYCCWNTSYCDYPCQQKHWPNHMSKCTQNLNQPTAQIVPTTTSMRQAGGQQLILRPANPPSKGGLGRVFTKPVQKVYMNRNLTAPKTMRVQTTAGNLLTMMETTPGNYQLVTSSSLVKPGTSLTTIKPGLISVAGNANQQPQHKNLVSKAPIRLVGHNMPVATVLEDESD